MTPQETLREVAALRHSFHANQRLRLEFLASVSKLLRDYGVEASDELLSSLILSVPEEVLNGQQNGHGAQASAERSAPPPYPPDSPDSVAAPPASGDRSALPPRSPDRTAEPPIPPPGRSAAPPAPAERAVPPPASPDSSALPPRSPSS